MPKLKKLTGTWRGIYEYDSMETVLKPFSVEFTLVLKQHWFGVFNGSVTDDPPNGMHGTGSIAGDFSYPRIRFAKRMPICCVIQPDGQRITLREAIIAQGYPCEQEFPGPDIIYEGEVSDSNGAQGTWSIPPRFIRLPGKSGLGFRTKRMSGAWNMRLEGNYGKLGVRQRIVTRRSDGNKTKRVPQTGQTNH